MPAAVVIYKIQGNGRSLAVCQAMALGITACGDRVDVRWDGQYRRPASEDVAVFYGLHGKLPQVFKDYPAHGKRAVHIDLGYWGRHHNGNRLGYHKFVVSPPATGRHPTEYFQNRKHDGKRAAVFGVKALPWRKSGTHILIAGMGPKSCGIEGFPVEGWERAAIAQLRAVTDRPIMYRPKPSHKGAEPIGGTIFSDPNKESLEQALIDCHAVVTHHSNVAVDALVEGVPAFAMQGVAVPLALQDLRQIEKPIRPDNRESWINDVSYTQFNVDEMRSGVVWRHLKDEGLV